MPDETIPGFKLRHMLRNKHYPQGFGLNRFAFSPDGRKLLCNVRGYVFVWDVATGGLHGEIKAADEYIPMISDAAWSPSGKWIATCYPNGYVRLWHVNSGRLRREISVDSSMSFSIAWSSDGHTVYVGCESEIEVWNIKKNQFYGPFQQHIDWVNALALSPDGQMLASGGEDGQVCLWDVRKKILINSQVVHGALVNSLSWVPNGKKLAAGASDGSIYLFDVLSGHLLTKLEGHTKSINSVSFSYDGRLLASKSSDGVTLLWNCEGWKPVAAFNEPVSKGQTPNVVFHPNAPILATLVEKDDAIQVWDLDFDLLIRAAPERDDALYTTGKIALVGDSGVGKTGLGWRVARGEFKEHPSTHGQQFWVVDEFGATRSDGTQCEAVLWDLAGQPDYRLVHALFLDDVDLALVLFDPTNRQEPLKGVEYWLKQLRRERRDGRRRRAILVGARADRGAPTLTREEVEDFCRAQGVEAYVGTSALTGEGLEELLARVKSSIVWDEMPATVTTRTFKRVKEFVLALKAEPERKGVLVSPAELRARLEASDAEWEFTDAEMLTAVRHLSTHGYVSVLRGSSGEETILLAPDLLANLAASFVLEARRNPKGLGALEEARVLAGGYAFPELAGLSAEERDVLLGAAVVLFIEHNLCFRETLGTQTLLIFPALINQKRPLVEEVKTVEDASYRVTGAVENVYAALVVQLGYTNTFTRTNQWQNQAEYETARGDLCGFRQVNEREGETELVLYYAEQKAGARLLFQGLFEEFLRGRDVTVTKFPPLTCPNCAYSQPRTEVVKRIGEGRGFLFCGECGEKISLPKEGERVMLSRAEHTQLGREQERARRRTDFESALVRVKEVVRGERKQTPSCFVSYAWGEHERERWVRGLAVDLQNAGVDVLLDQKDNAFIGSNVGRFNSRVEDEEIDFIAVVGTPLYLAKYKNELSPEGNVVASEVDLINLRMTSTEQRKNTVLPLLVEGEPRTALPPFLRGRVRADFRDEAAYFGTLYDLILTLYRIPFDHPAVADLRDKLRAGEERLS